MRDFGGVDRHGVFGLSPSSGVFCRTWHLHVLCFRVILDGDLALVEVPSGIENNDGTKLGVLDTVELDPQLFPLHVAASCCHILDKAHSLLSVDTEEHDVAVVLKLMRLDRGLDNGVGTEGLVTQSVRHVLGVREPFSSDVTKSFSIRQSSSEAFEDLSRAFEAAESHTAFHGLCEPYFRVTCHVASFIERGKDTRVYLWVDDWKVSTFYLPGYDGSRVWDVDITASFGFGLWIRIATSTGV